MMINPMGKIPNLLAIAGLLVQVDSADSTRLCHVFLICISPRRSLLTARLDTLVVPAGFSGRFVLSLTVPIHLADRTPVATSRTLPVPVLPVGMIFLELSSS